MTKAKPKTTAQALAAPAPDSVQQMDPNVLNKIVLTGDISGLTDDQKMLYVKALCERYNLDPVTRPFDIIAQNGKEKLYANKSTTDQIREQKSLSAKITNREKVNDVYIVEVEVTDGKRTEPATGVVSIKGLSGDALANAIMKAETKAKRRATLSFVGLAMLDETEVETVPDAKKQSIDGEEAVEHQELKQPESPQPKILQQGPDYICFDDYRIVPKPGKHEIAGVVFYYNRGTKPDGSRWASFKESGSQGKTYWNTDEVFTELMEMFSDQVTMREGIINSDSVPVGEDVEQENEPVEETRTVPQVGEVITVDGEQWTYMTGKKKDGTGFMKLVSKTRKDKDDKYYISIPDWDTEFDEILNKWRAQ